MMVSEHVYHSINACSTCAIPACLEFSCLFVQAACALGSLHWPGWNNLPTLAGGIRELRLYGQALTDGQMTTAYNELQEKWKTISKGLRVHVHALHVDKALQNLCHRLLQLRHLILACASDHAWHLLQATPLIV